MFYGLHHRNRYPLLINYLPSFEFACSLEALLIEDLNSKNLNFKTEQTICEVDLPA